MVSDHILDELADVWNRPYWHDRYRINQVRATMRLLRAQAIFVEPDPTVRGIAKDEEDDLILATAFAGNVDYLVSGDRYLQRLGHFQSVLILSPRQFLDLLDEQRDAQRPT